MGLRKPLEVDIQRQCIEWLHLRGCLVWRQNQGGVKASYKGKSRFFRFCSMPGVSDIIGLLPGGVFLACEIKRPGNDLTIEQDNFLERVRMKGGVAIVAHSLDELEKGLEGLL